MLSQYSIARITSRYRRIKIETIAIVLNNLKIVNRIVFA